MRHFKRRPSIVVWIILLTLFTPKVWGEPNQRTSTPSKRLVYLVSDLRIPFWATMARGIQGQGSKSGFQVDILSAQNDAKTELKNTIKAIKDQVSGIIVSPTNSSACVTILKLAAQAKIPVVISDIGADDGPYVSYISSDNQSGAYGIGKILATQLRALKWEKGRVGIIAIPQKRANGKARTAGFLKAMKEAQIKVGGLKQQESFSYEETYLFTTELIMKNPDLRAVWLQGSDRYQGALDAIADKGKTGHILLVTFDAEPVFLDLIPKGIIKGAAMQQPYLMGEEAVRSLDAFLQGLPVKKNIQLPILAVSQKNIQQVLPTIQRNVLGLNLN